MDVLTLYEALPTAGRIRSKGNGEYAAPCPSCAGTDRFVMWPSHPSGAKGGRFLCRGCSLRGDGLEFLKVFQGMSYPEACAELRIEPSRRTGPPLERHTARMEWTPKPERLPSAVWMERAHDAACEAGSAGEPKAIPPTNVPERPNMELSPQPPQQEPSKGIITGDTPRAVHSMDTPDGATDCPQYPGGCLACPDYRRLVRWWCRKLHWWKPWPTPDGELPTVEIRRGHVLHVYQDGTTRLVGIAAKPTTPASVIPPVPLTLKKGLFILRDGRPFLMPDTEQTQRRIRAKGSGTSLLS